MAPRGDRDDWELEVETCRVELWRGYLTSSFVARGLDEAGTVIDSSSSFRWRSAKAPDTEEARLAHYELISRLKDAGWAPGDAAGEWYQTELARPTLVPPKPKQEAKPVPVEREVVVPLPTAPPPAPVKVVAPAIEPLPPPPRPAPTPAPARDRWRAVAVGGLAAAVLFLVLLGLFG